MRARRSRWSVLGCLVLAGLTLSPAPARAIDREARREAAAFVRIANHSAVVMQRRGPVYLRHRYAIEYVLGACQDALGDEGFGTSRAVNVVAVSMETHALVGAPFKTPLRVFGERLVAVRAHDRVLRRAAAAWRDIARASASFPTLPYASACDTFARWAHTGYAVRTAPLNIAHINRLFARIRRDQSAINRASRRFRKAGVASADANGFSSLADELFDDVFSDLES